MTTQEESERLQISWRVPAIPYARKSRATATVSEKSPSYVISQAAEHTGAGRRLPYDLREFRKDKKMSILAILSFAVLPLTVALLLGPFYEPRIR